MRQLCWPSCSSFHLTLHFLTFGQIYLICFVEALHKMSDYERKNISATQQPQTPALQEASTGELSLKQREY